ncbi:MAG: calcium/sodium antiporter [Eubacterium sp.]
MANIFTYTFFIIGLFLIIKGGDIFVDSATQAAKMLKIPNFIIGATIVSIATTLPEIIVSVQATVTKNVDMAVGNAIGSVTANTALILGLFITFMPFEIKRRDIFFKGISMILAIISLIIGCVITKKQTLQFKGESKEYYFLSALGVTLLISVFAVFIFENIKSIKKEVKNDENDKTFTVKEKVLCTVLFVFGAIGIVIGARLLVSQGTQIAKNLHISQRVISVIAVAIGTSLPELVTALSALKEIGTLSAGNILGANIIDLTLILPLCSLISIARGSGELAVSASSVNMDMKICLIVICIAVLPTIITQKFQRWQGILLLLTYGGYIYFVVK